MDIQKNNLTEEDLQEWEEKIKFMSHFEMARMWRFSPSGHPVFSSQYRLFKQFEEKFNELGGMTTAISKRLGWD